MPEQQAGGGTPVAHVKCHNESLSPNKKAQAQARGIRQDDPRRKINTTEKGHHDQTNLR